MAAHLHPDGVLLIEPWVLPEDWVESKVFVQQAEDGAAKLMRVIAGHREGTTSVLPIHYVWAVPGEIRTADERHVLGLFSRADYMDAVTAAGLEPEWDAVGLIGRGLVIGTAPPAM